MHMHSNLNKTVLWNAIKVGTERLPGQAIFFKGDVAAMWL